MILNSHALTHALSPLMEVGISEAVWIAIGSAAVSLSATIFMIVKWFTGEQGNLKIDGAGEITEHSLKLLEGYREEVKRLRIDVNTMRLESEAREKEYREKFKAQEKQIDDLYHDLADWQDWAERLSAQVVDECGKVPVPFAKGRYD